MDYAKHYEKLIERARNRILDGYVEVHHVLPTCMGGTDDLSNRVPLTPEEHYVAHQLLVKMHPNVAGLVYAVQAMTGNPWGKRNNKLYGWIRKQVALVTSVQSSARWQTQEYRDIHKAAMELVRARPEFRANLSKAILGRTYPAEQRMEIVAKRLATIQAANKPKAAWSDEAKANISAALRKTWATRRANGEQFSIAAKIKEARIKNGSYQFSAEHRANIGKSGIGRVVTDEQRAKISAALKGRKKSPEHVAKVAAANRKPAPPAPTPEELAQRKAERSAHCSEWQKGRTLPEQHKAKIAAGLANAYANGRRGAMSKLSDDQVREIRTLLQQPGLTQKQIAARYGISQAALSELKSGKSYQHVQ